MRTLEKTEIPEGSKGEWSIERFTVSRNGAAMSALRGMFNGTRRSTPPGEYTRLVRAEPHDCVIVMSDTPDELRDHRTALFMASGDVLIHGLGLGIITEACLRIDCVNSVTVVEIDQDVIDLVGPYLLDKWGERLTIVHADALTWVPPKGSYFDMVWHDIWDYICDDNLPDMHRLHRRYGKRSLWQGSWARDLCERMRD